MKVASFDIGIRNMAYCIFDISENQNSEEGGKKISFSVCSWNVLNLLEKTIEKKTCNCSVIRKGNSKRKDELCGKVAKYMKSENLFCEKHAKTSGFLIADKSRFKMKVEDLKKDVCQFIDIGQYKTKTAILEKLAEKSLVPVVYKKQKSSNELDLITIGHNLKKALDEIPEMRAVTHVIIENQISPIANRMKTIQGMLAQYFIMRVDHVTIEFVSSFNKLKIFNKCNDRSDKCNDRSDKCNDRSDKCNDHKSRNKKIKNEIVISNEINRIEKIDEKIEEIEEIEEKTDVIHASQRLDKKDYKQHKMDSILYCSQMIEKNTELEKWKSILQTSKKDDLADSFLQGLWWLKFHKIIDIAEDLNIICVSS
jgi:hypothetical protein